MSVQYIMLESMYVYNYYAECIGVDCLALLDNYYISLILNKSYPVNPSVIDSALFVLENYWHFTDSILVTCCAQIRQ